MASKGAPKREDNREAEHAEFDGYLPKESRNKETFDAFSGKHIS